MSVTLKNKTDSFEVSYILTNQEVSNFIILHTDIYYKSLLFIFFLYLKGINYVIISCPSKNTGKRPYRPYSSVIQREPPSWDIKITQPSPKSKWSKGAWELVESVPQTADVCSAKSKLLGPRCLPPRPPPPAPRLKEASHCKWLPSELPDGGLPPTLGLPGAAVSPKSSPAVSSRTENSIQLTPKCSHCFYFPHTTSLPFDTAASSLCIVWYTEWEHGSCAGPVPGAPPGTQ